MIASVYIKDGIIHFFNEQKGFSQIEGIAYRLGIPLLNFLCYEQERFDEGFSSMAETFEIPGSQHGKIAPEYLVSMEENMTDLQKHEIYIYFYAQEFMKAMYSTDSPLSPQEVVEQLSKDFRSKRDFMIDEVNLLLNFRKAAENASSLEYLYWLDGFNKEKIGGYVFLEKPFSAFYGAIKPEEVVELYEIHSIDDLLRFEFIKMIEHDIFIKKCKNCEQFFIPKRRADAEYCDSIFADTGKKCSEVGAMVQYEKKVAENPILEAHKKAYRRFNSRTRLKKMTQAEFLQWSEQAAQKRDECLAGDLSFDEYIAWLEQGRIRRSRSNSAESN